MEYKGSFINVKFRKTRNSKSRQVLHRGPEEGLPGTNVVFRYGGSVLLWGFSLFPGKVPVLRRGLPCRRPWFRPPVYPLPSRSVGLRVSKRHPKTLRRRTVQESRRDTYFLLCHDQTRLGNPRTTLFLLCPS